MSLPPKMRSIFFHAGYATLALVAWIGVAAGLGFTQPVSAPLAVVGPTELAARAVAAAGGRLVSITAFGVTARSDRPDFVARLYGSGALLVVPAVEPGGCVTADPVSGR